MKQVTAQHGDRLDQIAYSEYGTLEYFNKVMDANLHLSAKPILENGDIVNMPTITMQVQEIKVKTLW
ncbi:MAG TPA: phage tail protein [Sulfurovum sp. UBA12169]|nr:MAG TPA: phage tail protein [Sulfurovum sp. UBA12169]